MFLGCEVLGDELIIVWGNKLIAPRDDGGAPHAHTGRNLSSGIAGAMYVRSSHLQMLDTPD